MTVPSLRELGLGVGDVAKDAKALVAIEGVAKYKKRRLTSLLAQGGVPMAEQLMLTLSQAIRSRDMAASQAASSDAIERLDAAWVALDLSVRSRFTPKWNIARTRPDAVKHREVVRLAGDLYVVRTALSLANAGLWRISLSGVSRSTVALALEEDLYGVGTWSNEAVWLHRGGADAWDDQDASFLLDLATGDDVERPFTGAVEAVDGAFRSSLGFGVRHLFILLELCRQEPERVYRSSESALLDTLRSIEAARSVDGKLRFGSDEQLRAALRFTTLNPTKLAQARFEPEMGVRWFPSAAWQPLIEVGRDCILWSPASLGHTLDLWGTHLKLGIWPGREGPSEVVAAMNTLRGARLSKDFNRLEANLGTVLEQSRLPYRRNIEPKDSYQLLGIDVPPEVGEIDAVVVLPHRSEIWVLDAKDDAIFTAPDLLARTVENVVVERRAKGRRKPSDSDKLAKKVASIADNPLAVAGALGATVPRSWRVVGMLVTRILHPAVESSDWPIVPIARLGQLLGSESRPQPGG